MKALGISLALSTAATAFSQAPALEKARILDLVNEGGFFQVQVQRLHTSAIAVGDARTIRREAVDALNAAHEHLEEVFDVLAAGRRLSESQRAQLDAAMDERRAVDEKYREAVDAAVQFVLTSLTDEQKYQMAVTDEMEEEINRIAAEIRSAPDADWGKLRDNLAWQIAAPLLEQFMQGMGKGGEQQKRQIGQEKENLHRSAQEYLEMVRRGNDRLMSEFKQRLAMSRMKPQQIEMLVRQYIRRIIEPIAAVESLTERINRE